LIFREKAVTTIGYTLYMQGKSLSREKTERDNCYLVGLPDFPGQKWRTHGNTYAESVKNAEEVLESLMELYQKLGESLPEPEINKKREILQK